MTPEPLAPEFARLLDAERTRPAPPADCTERVFARLTQSIASVPVPAAPVHPSAGASHLLRAPAIKAIALLAAGAAAGAGAHALLRSPTVETRVETRIVYVPQEAPVPAAEEAPAPAPAPAKILVPARPKDDKHARDRQLAAERVLVEQARSALARGQPKAALEVLLRHQHDWPQGQLVEEREALWILALAADGRKDEARSRADLFRERYPKSILLRSINSALAP